MYIPHPSSDFRVCWAKNDGESNLKETKNDVETVVIHIYVYNNSIYICVIRFGGSGLRAGEAEASGFRG